jgi:prepilin-type N-terminal cleavage/methylation domain-containing protein
MKKSKGFSLIEVMISIAIIGVIGVISTAIFTQTLKISSQTDTISKLKQNGDQAISLIEDSLRSADAVICYGSTSGTAVIDTIVIRTLEGKYTKFRFVPPTPPTGTPITSNGYIARQDNLDPTALSTFCTSPPDLTREVILTNNDLSSGVSISNGQFYRLVLGYLNRDTINVSFYVNKTKSEPGSSGESAFIAATIQVR